MSSEPSVILQLAPPGTGKTFGAAHAIPDILQRHPKSRIMLTTHANLSLYRIVQEVIPILAEEKKLIVLSGMAKDEYRDHFQEYSDHLLLATVEELLVEGRQPEAKWERSHVRRLERYAENCKDRPRIADEKGALKVIQTREIPLPRIIFATTAMLEDCDFLLDSVTHLVVDEAGQIPICQIVPIICRSPKIKTVLLTGDDKQLLNYIEDVPPVVRPYGWESLLDYLPKLQGIDTVQLKTSYRFHHNIARCLADAIYGDKLVAAAQGPAMSPLLLPNPECPILLLHQTDPDERDTESFSRHNEAQADIASKILETFPEDRQVVVLCLYAAEKKRMRQKLQHRPSIRVLTVDSFQANQSDAVYLLTTRSPTTSGESMSDFLKDDRRATVALSRAKNLLVIHGNLTTLSQGAVWDKFLSAACKMTQAIDPRPYLNDRTISPMHF